MNKKSYYVIQEYYDTKDGRKWLARMEEVLNSRNLLDAIRPNFWPGDGVNIYSVIVSVNACDTRKEAYQTIDGWNHTFRQDGRHLFLDAV